MRRRPAIGAACLFVLLACLSGCSQHPDDPQTSSDSAEVPTYSSDGDYRAAATTHMTAMIECLNTNGWHAVADSSGLGYEVASVTADNRDSFTVAREECLQEVGPEPIQAAPSQARLEELYAETVAAGECLADLGYLISAAPSLAQWLDRYDEGPWTPYTDLPALSDAEWRRVNEECPQP